ncbi:MAG: ATP-binding protein [Desulfobacterales bacterium]|nr:ATP-binding protein [Desulfobacterales bacterium]
MKISIASGKGGTGKTTVTASLASIWSTPLVAVDLDVEEPNLHLFLNPEITGHETALMEVPVADESLCNQCRKCTEICQFKAISVLGDVILTFTEMCHGCGGCIAVCPEGALSAGSRELGEISWGTVGSVDFLMGRLRVGEAMSPPLMRQVKQRLAQMIDGRDCDVIIDAPPGVSCPAVAAVMDADAIVLVTEPTPFGVFDLALAHQAFAPLGKPMAVVVNRAGIGSPDVYKVCKDRDLPIIAEIPYDRRIAEAYADGRIVADATPETRGIFDEMVQRIRSMVPDADCRSEVSHG